MKIIITILLLLVGAYAYADQGESALYCTTIDMNTTSDQQLNLGVSNVIVRRVTMSGVSISLTTAAGGIYTATSKGGIQLVPSTQVYSSLTNSNKFLDLTLQNAALTNIFTGQNIFFSLTTPQGVPATARLCVYGDQIN